ncbi:hypothetical protein BOTCAL_0317g00120 [Botryotinia calthae]|uniref:Uncharacterized protein n=1 Tax=Botryotinia calthae TaxID=38488 RepID=A0A4Y8CWF3_9HELO|nr:hypothetical protein BOTCAL_0317g00120 [Botryotinia calthae]
MAEDRLNVVIIGGSLAGLMHGAMLKQISHNVHILEQYPTSIRGSQAAGMSTGIYGQELLKRYDKIKNRPHFVTASKLEVVDAKLNVTESRSVPFKFTNWKTFYYRLRANFDEFKSDVTYEDVQTGTNEVLHLDLVIAADGAGLATRKILFPDLKTPYAGILTWQGIVPENAVSKETLDFSLTDASVTVLIDIIL